MSVCVGGAGRVSKWIGGYLSELFWKVNECVGWTLILACVCEYENLGLTIGGLYLCVCFVCVGSLCSLHHWGCFTVFLSFVQNDH